MENHLSRLRENAGISLSEMAARFRLTPRELRRYETGKRPTPVPLAMAICQELGVQLSDAFREGASLWRRAREVHPKGNLPTETMCRLREVGLESDWRVFTLKLLLRGWSEAIFFDISPSDADRLYRVIQYEPARSEHLSFLVFDSDDLRIAVRQDATLYCHFLWDAAFPAIRIEKQTQEPEPNNSNDKFTAPGESFDVEVYFDNREVPLRLGMEAEQGCVELGETEDLNNMFLLMESGELSAGERLRLLDEDGEAAFVRAGDITLVKVALDLLDKDERMYEDDR